MHRREVIQLLQTIPIHQQEATRIPLHLITPILRQEAIVILHLITIHTLQLEAIAQVVVDTMEAVVAAAAEDLLEVAEVDANYLLNPKL